jgi:ABC-type branched-subunit amino acid transport system substrate-binding protein
MKRFTMIFFAAMLLFFVAGLMWAGKKEEEKPIVVGHLSYHSGPFADVGPFFDGITDFTLAFINEDPPLGRKMVAVHQDIGTIGEAQAARKLIESEGAEVLLNPAHEYASYRDWLLQYLIDHDTPVMPSVHGGSIEREIGGTPEEPIFRGAPMDTAQSVAAVIQAKKEGARRVVLLATEIAGSQLQMDAAIKAAKEIGLNVVDTINVQPEMPSYRGEVSRIADVNPDTLLMFSQAEDGGTIVKQAAEAGMSLAIIGTTEWLQDAFAKAATMSAIKQHKKVWISGFSYVEGPAWDFYAPRWRESEYAQYAQPENSYAIEYYDVLNVTALAIEAAGTTEASKWAKKVRDVAMAPGKKVYTYKEGVEALRAGEEIDYSGVTGEFDYTETGVVSGAFGMFEWTSLDNLEQVLILDGKEILDLDK